MSTADKPHHSQQAAIDFLADPASHPGCATVQRIDTHISHIFLAGGLAYKLKRAICTPYLDYRTIAQRGACCERELALNRRTAPGLYLCVQPLRRSADGRIGFEGNGPVIDWVVVMRAFAQDQLFDHLQQTDGLSLALLRELTDSIVAFHAQAEQSTQHGGAEAMQQVIAGLAQSHAALPPDIATTLALEPVLAGLRSACAQVQAVLDARRAQGDVRRCHGDLHLGNICLWQGRPLLFDCIEFSDALACIDVAYDLAFLVMDLWHRGTPPGASLVFNRYADLAGSPGVCAVMPLFLALRAAIRAVVRATAAAQQPDAARRVTLVDDARAYARTALACLAPRRPALVAIGGLSGSGKSTLAAALAPHLGPAPGARVLRSDVLRKRLAQQMPEARLSPAHYDAAATRAVYDQLAVAARAALADGACVIVDAVFATEVERDAVAAVASAMHVPFTGLWLDVPQALAETRIAARTGDASDATVAIHRRQRGYDLGAICWHRLDGGSDGVALTLAASSLIESRRAADAPD